MTKKVLITGSSIAPEFLGPLEDADLRIVNPSGLLSEDQLAAELADSTAYLLGGDEFASEKALKAGANLKIVAFLGVGYESFVDVGAATQLGIPVTNTPGTLTDSVAEFTIGQLLNVRRLLTSYSNSYRAGKRDFEVKQKNIAGHSIGIVGLGAIGTRIAEMLTAGFGASVSYYSRTRKVEEESRLGLNYLELDELVASVESLILMVPGNDTTRGLIDSALVSKFKEGLLLINTARPEIVQPEALSEGLSSGRVAVAAFDGFYGDGVGEEIMAKFGEDRLLVTGHIGSLTDDARDGMAKMAVTSILNILNSGSDKHVVNRT